MFDIVGRPFSDVHTTAVVVQRLAVIVRYIGAVEFRATSRVEVHFYKAIFSLQRRTLITACDTALVRCVHGDPVVDTVVNAFDDICNMLVFCQSFVKRTEALTNLAVGRPGIRSKKPIGWPCTTTSRHVFDIGDEHAMGIRIVADQAYGWATWSSKGKFVCGVNAHSRTTIDSCGISVPQSRCSADILNMPVCRIATGVEVEVVKKVGWQVFVY